MERERPYPSDLSNARWELLEPVMDDGSGLGIFRWVVERTTAWLHGFRRLRIRWSDATTSTRLSSASPPA